MFVNDQKPANPLIKEKISRALLTVLLGMFVSIGLNAGLLSSPIVSPLGSAPEKKAEAAVPKRYEVFGFAPYWTINKLDNVDFNTLTTLAYFGVPVLADGSFDTNDIGYTTFKSKRAGDVFEKARGHGTKIVLTLTQMDNATIRGFVSDESAQDRLVKNTVDIVTQNKLDGVNIDFEYAGNPGDELRDEFTVMVKKITDALHKEVPGSKVSVSVYAGSMKEPKIYDIKELAMASDSIFMMAYDFATRSSDHVIPTAPLFGHKEGKYWYDISTAVEDFLAVMPAEKLILGVPWYGYNYPVAGQPEVKVARYQGYSYYYWWRGRRYVGYQSVPANAQTYTSAVQNNKPELTGWDDEGKVGWQAYQEGGVWRMLFLDDVRSLKHKYQFAKNKQLGGVGMWALGFDSGTTEMWDLLSSEFGNRIAYGNK